MSATPTTEPAPCEVWIVCDQAGDYAVGSSADAAREKYAEDIGELSSAEGFRMVKLLVRVPLPEVVELSGDAPAVGSAALLCVA